MKNKLFRQQALDRFDSPERINEYVVVTRPSLFILLVALVACIVAVILWVGYGSVNDYVKAKGVVFPHEGLVKVSNPLEGVVREVYVRRGDFVQQGTRLIRFSCEGSYGYITAPHPGIVLSCKAEDESFQAFEACAYLYPQETEKQMRELIAYVTFKDLRKLEPGMEVQVSPADLSREEYGFMHGHITEVAHFPTNREEANRQFKSEELLSDIFPEEAAFEVKVLLDTDPENGGQISWSNKVPEEVDMHIGAFCDLQIMVKKRTILELLFKKKQ